jgi:branched-chain amino acid transport system substrate-binding protein
MKNNILRKLLFLMLVVAVVVPLTLAQEEGDTVTIAPGDNVVLGLATILSGEGLVPLGDDITRGVELALAARDNMITVGDAQFPVVLDIQDDQCSAEGGQAVANYFVSQPGVVALVGPTCSSACRAAGPIFDEAGFTSISSSCTAVDLTAEDTGFASFNRTTANDDAQGPAAAEFIYNELGFTSIATIHDSSPYGEGLVESMTARFEELGGTVVYADAINVGDTDFRNLLDSIAGAGAELIYFGGFPAEAARLAEQRADVGLEDTPMMGADGILSPEFVNLAGDAATGVYASAPAAAASEAYDEFVALYTETYDTEPTAAFHAYAYDAANMLLDAIEATGTIDDSGNLVVSRAAVAEFIRAFGSEEPYAGLSGELSCAGNGECALGGIGFFQVQDGAFARLDVSPMGEDMEMMGTEEAAATEEAGS